MLNPSPGKIRGFYYEMKNFYLEDTIAALSTPCGTGGIAVIRISGPDAFSSAGRLFRSPRGSSREFVHYRAMYGHAVRPSDGSFIDEAIFLPMKAPHSYTTEDTVEIQCHGGSSCVYEILGALFSVGVRQALPGEFTKRAFLGGRIDLLQAEAVMDIIGAKSRDALENAEEQLEGKYSEELSQFKESIARAAAAVEAPLDYPDEDLYAMDSDESAAMLDALAENAALMLAKAEGGRLCRDGAKVSLIGRPNAGKSSILNMLLGASRAIVTDIAGTTRDTIEESCSIRGALVNLCDTAGIHETDSVIEKIGIEKTIAAADESDIIIAVLDSSSEISDEDREVLRIASESGKPFFAVLNKSDLPSLIDSDGISSEYGCSCISISARTGSGSDELEKLIYAKIMEIFPSGASSRFSASGRCREALSSIASDLREAADAARAGLPGDICAVPLRAAVQSLEALTGEKYDEDILDRVFSEFCIGK